MNKTELTKLEAFDHTVETVEDCEKSKYEKPVLSVVKFMFESDITWGSFEENEGGDNEVNPDDDWWS